MYGGFTKNTKMLTKSIFSCFALALMSGTAIAQPKPKPPKKTQSERKVALTPEEQLATFTVPEGFVVELVASEKNGIINPIDISFDDAGRLWTQTAEMYPLDPGGGNVGFRQLLSFAEKSVDELAKKYPEYKRIGDLYKLKTKGTDRVVIIDNPLAEPSGQARVFADGLTIPQSILPYKNGVYVAHGSELLYLKDTDGDGKADAHETALTGFGFNDSHTMTHCLVRGPGGWIHFSHGALNGGKVVAQSGESTIVKYSKIGRFSIDGEHVEVVNNGLQNIWGFHLKEDGQWYGTEANDMFQSLVPMHPYMGYKGLGGSKIRDYQPIVQAVHDFKVSGTGISGLAYDENGSKGFPEEWKNAGFLANPITSKINAVVCDRNADGSLVSKHLPDFLESSDDWFRPVHLEFLSLIHI